MTKGTDLGKQLLEVPVLQKRWRIPVDYVIFLLTSSGENDGECRTSFVICPVLGVHMFLVPACMCLRQAWGPGSLGVVAVRGIPGWQDW